VAEKRDTGKRAYLVVLTLLFLLASSTILYPGKVVASTGSGPAVVLFTTQGVFAPQQLVTLCANVSYNGAPVNMGYLVSFQVNGPSNEFENITIFGSGTTNATGLAAFSFRIPWPSNHQEEIVFGNWSALATVDIAQMTAIGTWTFLVGWILQIISITTLNSAFMPQTTFFRQDIINFNLTVKNIATVAEPAAVTIEAMDADDYPMFNITMQGLTFQPGESHLNGSSRIPDTAAIGNATATAAIYTKLPDEGGVLYSPSISTEFEISERPVHDIGITSITLSTGSVYVGGIVDVYVTVKDNGTATENNCILTTYYNSSLIETLQVTLTSGSQVSETFSWNTSTVKPGLYQISASATLPNNETDPSPGDNTLIDGTVQVMTPPPPKVVHDIGITSITVSTTSIYLGGIVDVYVTVKDNGTATENFGLSAYYNSSLIETLQVTLTSGSQVSETFSWNTSTVKPGLYQISASAPLAGDISPGDNTLIDGYVKVMTLVPSVSVRPLWIILLVILLLFLLALLAILLLRRRKTDESELLEQVSFFT
jgi:hypothetical protein